MSNQQSKCSRERVWDPLVRLLHWGLAASVVTALISGDHILSLHLAAGYCALALVATRLVWGVFGSRHARFAGFLRPPGEVMRYLRCLITGAEGGDHYLGHNPAGGWMVVALLGVTAAAGVSGLALLAVESFSGPLVLLFDQTGERGSHLIEELHEWFGNLLMLLVPLHLLGVAISSWRHHENLVLSMINGRKRAAGGGH